MQIKSVGSKPRIIVSGILFWYPLAGVTWQFLHFMLGLRRLGYDPVYIEDSSRWVYNPALADCTPDAEYNVSRIAPVLEQFGLKDRWAFRGRYEGGRCWGLSEEQLRDLYQSADVMLNVTGAQELLPEHARCPVRIYWETDPVVSQIQVERGDAAVIAALDGHTHHFTYGENIGQRDCPLSAARYHWRPTRQPVVLDLWQQPFDAGARSYNTIATWQKLLCSGDIKHNIGGLVQITDLQLREAPTSAALVTSAKGPAVFQAELLQHRSDSRDVILGVGRTVGQSGVINPT